jgi:hypothetical protein
VTEPDRSDSGVTPGPPPACGCDPRMRTGVGHGSDSGRSRMSGPRAVRSVACVDIAPRPPVTLWLLRIPVTLNLLAVLVQPVLAGRYLTGEVDAIGTHAAVGSGLAALGLLTAGLALLHVVAGRGAPWVLLAAVGLFLALGFQIGMGYARAMAVHVPLGVGIVLASVLLTAGVWSRRLAVRRPRAVVAR